MAIPIRASGIPPIHFIGGIHGVGKTTFASAISTHVGFSCQNAGAIIKGHRNTTQNTEKRVDDVQGNQNLLLDGIKALNIIDPILLDGHFCLLTKDNTITQIPFDTFADLGLRSITVVTDSPEVIHRRLMQRDSTTYDLELLRRFQDAEIAWAEEVGARLSIPVASFLCEQVVQAKEHIQRANLTW